MLEGIEYLSSVSSWLSWRELIRLVLLSGLFALVCFTAFPRNAPSKRVLLMISAATLMVLPWAVRGDWLVWHIRMSETPSFSLSRGLPEALLWIWLIVAVLLLLRHAVAVVRELVRLHRLPSICDDHTISTLDRLCADMGVNRPGLRQGGQACSTSLWRPTIVLPQDARYWDDSTLASVLAHELVHIKRRDDAWLFGFRLCALLYWWLPWIASMYAAFVRCVEESCDDAAAEWVGHDLTYIEALAGVAVGQSRPPLGGVTHMHQHHLVGRIGRFGKLRDIELDTRGVYWSVTGVLAVVGFLSGIEPVQEVYAAQTVTVRSEAAASARVNSASVYPVTHQYTLFPAPLSDGQHKRLYSPSYAAPVIYPGAAIRQGIEGVVTVAFYVNADGAVSSPRIVSSEPAGLFEGAALRAVLNSRYPAARHGVARQTGAYHAGSLSSVEVHRYFAFRLEQR